VPTENISYDCDSGNYTITAIPSAGQSGSSTITVTAIAPDGLTSSTSFDLTVFALPVISSIADQETVIDYPISIAFQITDTEGGNLQLSAISSGLTVISNENISFSSTNITTDGSSYTLNATPGTPETITLTLNPSNVSAGNTTITISIDDHGSIVEQAFECSVLSPFTVDENITLSAVDKSAVAFGDYDNDGDLDLLITGNSDSGKIAKIYQNTAGMFSEVTGITLDGVSDSTSKFLDYDNDGDLDIFIDGFYIAKLYKNTGAGFEEDTDSNFIGYEFSSSAFGDYDNDGDLDLIISGESENGKIINVYRNNINIANTAPAEPENLSANVTGENVIFSWSAASDPETITPSGLSYNLQIGTSSGSCDILAPMALPLSNGYRQIVDRGVIQQLTATVHIDTAGTYYWRVQAIDTGFTGSSFSEEYSFTINDVAPVPGNNGLITPSSYLIHTSEITLSWELASDIVSLTNSLEYRVYSSTTSYEDSIYAWEHLSTALSGWISNTNTFLISNSNESHYFVVIVRDTTGNKTMYHPLKMGTFSHMTDIELTGVSYGSSAFGDYDNDGDLDILITGFSDNGKIAKVYRNTAGSFTEDTAIKLTGVSYSSSIFADYDNDNDLDLLMTGYTGSERIARVYNNTGCSFTEDTAIAITGVSESSSTFVDYDNDGDLDILITGYDGSERFAIIYQNTGGSFSEATDINLTGVDYGKASFGDYDNDGDLDILISGYDGINRIAKVYQNTGGSFSLEAGINLVGTNSGSSFFFDYDNDGDLDILINGKTGNFTGDQISIIYRNTGGNFIEDTSIDLPDTQQNPAAFGDYDNDGDLDILLTGDSNSGRIARIYRNNYNNSNALPAAPTALTAVVTGQTVLLSWSAASDAETISAAGLNYNLRIGSSSGGNDILSPMALPLSSGYRLIPERGMFQNLTATVKLPAGTYYWSVQSIDTAFAGSEFATETTFVVEPTPPSISSISSQSTIIDYPISIAFQLTDVDGGNIGISASSSDLSLVSIENISFTGANMISDGLNYTIQSISDIPESITMIIDLSSSMAGR
jgi:hypothetical protein